jgi:hypothetical protein
MRRLLAICLLGASAVAGAAPAGADPADLVPYCSGDQTPMDHNCRPMPHQEVIHSGLDPQLPYGLDPANPAVLG